MSEKGGKKAEQESLISLKMILTAIVGVLLGIVFVLTLIFTGVIVGERYRDDRVEHTQKEHIADVVAVNYEWKNYKYYAAIDGAGEGSQEFKSLFRMLGTDKDYFVIESQTDYDKVVSTIASLGGEITKDDLNLPENYFYSGSLILITAEMRGLSEFKLNSITRNENYDLRIDVSKTDASEYYNVGAEAILIKIPNIQPKVVEVVRRAE